MSVDGVGFGHGSFGHFPFGRADYGNEVVIKTFAAELLDDPTDPTGVNQRLLHYLNLIKDSVNRVKTAIDEIPDQIDFDQVREDLIVYLGRTYGVEIDDAEPADFRRSLVGGAILFYRIKGTLESYKIRGKISGFDVDVFQLYKLAPMYVPLIPSDDLFNIPAGSDNFFTDLPPGTVSGTPSVVSCDYCLTSSIKMSFTVVKAQPPAVIGQPNLFDRLVFKLKDIIPVHIRELLFEIVAIILVDEHQNLEVQVQSDVQNFMPVAVFKRFDAFTADVTPLDSHGFITGTATLT